MLCFLPDTLTGGLGLLVWLLGPLCGPNLFLYR